MQPHIRLSKSMTRAKYALLPGDPERVDRIVRFLDNPEMLGQNREFRAARGEYKGVEILVLSTGIGGPSTAIAVEELRQIGIDTLIRIGSCGALQETLALGEVIIAHGAVADDGTSKTYAPASYPACADPQLTATLMQLALQMNIPASCGLVRSHDSFYTDREAELDAEWSARGILGADMETAALMVVGALRGLRTASLLNVVVAHNGCLDSSINNYVQQETRCQQGEVHQISLALQAIYFDSQQGEQ
ncbi:nucleoside phosphorylase [Citrobacter sp. Ct235]|uniref:nucleoside phosphorylase n=1 Tax=Citrobacter sp. Ct235 TaxID=2985157 RepID=UPI002574ECDD|nr:nucleoside phosphorylase [Citrobacter sp. Ct235]MDM2736035.1 nucleoside phosphorylase [Citrobacter sp. Ct235]